MRTTSILSTLLTLCIPALLSAQGGNFETCYLHLCEDGELTALQADGTDKIEVRSTTDDTTYEVISFSVTFVLGKSKIECDARGNTLTARCVALRDKLAAGDEMIITNVVFKDLRGGGEIRTAPELRISIVKPEDQE